jgi:sulfonate transport system substrate-binding protein
MRLKFYTAVAATLATAMLIAGAAAGRAAPEPLVIRAGWAETPGHLAPLVAELAKRHPEVMPNDGKVYEFEPVRFPGSTPQIQALAIKQLEVAAFSDSAFALAVTNAHLDVQIVADVIQTGREGYFPGEYVVARDGPIKTIADVKGKRVATNAIGSEADSTMRAMLRKNGLRDSDFTTVEANFANQPAMLEQGKVDMIELLPQFASELMATGKYRVLFTAAEVHGISQAVFWCMRRDFIAAHRPELTDFFTDYMRAMRWFLNPANRDEALGILAAVTHKPLKDVEFAFTPHDFYRSPDLMPDIPAVQREIDEDVALGVLPKRVVVSPNYVDLTLIKAAKERLDGHGA